MPKGRPVHYIVQVFKNNKEYKMFLPGKLRNTEQKQVFQGQFTMNSSAIPIEKNFPFSQDPIFFLSDFDEDVLFNNSSDQESQNT